MHEPNLGSAALDALPSPTVVMEPGGLIGWANRAWWEAGEALLPKGVERRGEGADYHAAMARVLPTSDCSAIRAGLSAVMDGSTACFQYEYSCSIRSGRAWFHLEASRIDDAGNIVITHTDVTRRVSDEKTRAWQAGLDPLTALPSRARLYGLVADALSGPQPCTVLYLDVDGFKTVNDSLGHQVGDLLIRVLADRLGRRARVSDVMGRLGGDEFLVLAYDCDGERGLALAEDLRGAFAEPFALAGMRLSLTASIGVASSAGRTGSVDADTLIGDADAALYAAKGAGRDRVHLFTRELRDAARWRLEVATKLADPATYDQLEVHYQPIMHLPSGKASALEALIRWRHPERGLMMPDSFIPVAEETGAVVPMTRWLLDEVIRQTTEWAVEGVDVSVGINISACHLSSGTLVADVRRALSAHDLPADHLVLELTETSIAEDPVRGGEQMRELVAMGVRLAIDDFGTGWSTLARLLAMPMDTLKLDRSLLQGVCASDGVDVMSAIVALADSLRLRSTAEGVETLDQLRMVSEAGCDYAQGWLFARAMPAADLGRWMKARVADPSPWLDTA
ncbi:EAL domain-containing protein [Modestobacter sp. I12A-02628]|nr:EAL domain-containing protein [Goekera deserti]MPR00060.1 EAL domain-containing protein [Goekera deserti]NDI49839.1 EAL domain-containing protein [Goekera deserti]